MQGDTFESATTSLPSMMDMWRERSICKLPSFDLASDIWLAVS